MASSVLVTRRSFAGVRRVWAPVVHVWLRKGKVLMEYFKLNGANGVSAAIGAYPFWP
ncbi:MAG: hypothetical protein IKF78_03040 [Atopobiaceae bacterium]|nr:hypothetical protein [Atopobiaceae bacterium]